MKAAFISYRRKDTVDVAGRIFDRLSGYFGPGNVLLDVDALVSGANYRTQIERLLDRCGVVLAVIGQDWLTTKDDAGRRRLDNPDDQLRIEIAVALKAGKKVVPVLVHDARMPQADELPEELKPLAALPPQTVQSGSAFNTDMELLIERLGESGMKPPESQFPWQMVLLPLGIAVVLAALAGASYFPIRGTTDDFVLQQVSPTTPMKELQPVGFLTTKWQGGQCDRAQYDRILLRDAMLIYLPLAAGPMLIVWGKRKCCLSKERTASQRHYAQGAGRLPTPKSGKSVLCLALGVGSIGAGPLTALPAIILGAFAWAELRRRPTWMRGRSLVVVGVLAASVSLAASVLLHLPEWRLRSWLRAMEIASQSEEKGDHQAASREFDRSLDTAGNIPNAAAVSRVRRAKNLMALKRYDDAVADLSAAIEAIEARAAAKAEYENRDYEARIGEWAHKVRAEAYDQLGQVQDADADRQWVPSMIGAHTAPIDNDDSAPMAPAPPTPEAPPPADPEISEDPEMAPPAPSA